MFTPSHRKSSRITDPYERGFWSGVVFTLALLAFVVLWVHVGGKQ